MGNLCSIRRPLLTPAPELNYPFSYTERQTDEETEYKRKSDKEIKESDREGKGRPRAKKKRGKKIIQERAPIMTMKLRLSF
jgi:hypothetical protein